MSIINPSETVSLIPVQKTDEHASGVEAGIAILESEIRSSIAARHASYCATGLMACELDPHARHDEWDDDPSTSIHYVKHEGVIVGSMRVIEATSKFGLQARKFVALPSGMDDAHVVEISRVAINPSFTVDDALRRAALLALFGSVIQHRWMTGHHTFVQTMRKGMLFRLLKLGIPMTVERLIEIEDTTQEGVPLSGEPLYLGHVSLEDIAASTYAQSAEIYQAFFGRVDPIVTSDSARVALMRARIRSAISGRAD